MITSSPLAYQDVPIIQTADAPEGVIVLVHGVAECGRAWSGCVPALSQDHRLIVPDLPGCGATPVVGVDAWSLDALADLLAAFMRSLALSDVHLVGAKFGGTLALCTAARHPALVRTLTILDVHAPAHAGSGTSGARDEIRQKDLRTWAARTMRARLGSEASAETIAQWTDYMASSDRDATLALMSAVDGLAIEPLIRNIQMPTLLLTARNSPIASAETARRWASVIPNASVDLVDGDAYHIAAAYPAATADRVLYFIGRHRG